MSATIKRKHLVLTGLVIALGTAMFVNWYYTKPEAKSVSKAADETTTVSANLGDAMYVNGTAAAAESDWLSEAKLKRTSAHDEAKSALEDVINSSDADSDSKQKAYKKHNRRERYRKSDNRKARRKMPCISR